MFETSGQFNMVVTKGRSSWTQDLEQVVAKSVVVGRENSPKAPTIPSDLLFSTISDSLHLSTKTFLT